MARSDEQLVSEVQAGSLEAFDELVARHQDRVHALAYRILGSREDAADIQQETFVRAWSAIRSFKGQAAFSTWLHRIAVNLCLSRKRRKSESCRVEPVDEDRLHAAESGSVGCMEKTETAMLVRQVLDEMPACYRVLLVLREVEGRSCEEIAGVVGGSVDSVRSRLCRARKAFKERMRPYLQEEVYET